MGSPFGGSHCNSWDDTNTKDIYLNTYLEATMSSNSQWQLGEVKLDRCRIATYNLLCTRHAKTQTPKAPLAEYTAANAPLPTHFVD
jgi:hypothetical protein